MSISVCSKCGKRNRVDVTKWRSGTTPVCRNCGKTLSLPNSVAIGSTARAFGVKNVAIWIRKSIKKQIQIPIFLTIALGLSVFSIDHFISKYKNNFDLYSDTLLFERSTVFSKGLAFVKFEGKWYLVNANGNIISKAKFDDVKGTWGDFFPVEKNGKWGFLDRKGKLIIDYLYDSCFAACTFRNGLALVKVGNRYGWINPKNEFIINPQFDDANDFSDDGLAWVRISNMEGIIDYNGNYVIPLGKQSFRYKSFHKRDDGLIPATIWGSRLPQKVYLDLKGKIKINLDRTYRLEPFHKGLALINGDWLNANPGVPSISFIDVTGNKVLGPFEDAGSYSEGLIAVKTNGRFGYINSHGRYIINPQFDNAYSFDKTGRAKVAVGSGENKKWGFIDRTGKYLVNPVYEDIWSSHNGFFLARQNKKWGILNDKLEVVLAFEFDGLFLSEDGIASLFKDKKTGFKKIF